MSLRMTEEQYQDLIKRRAGIMKDISHQHNVPTPRNVNKLAEDTIPKSAYPVKAVKKARERKTRQPNKTETAYLNRLKCEFPGSLIRYEGITLLLENGCRYTPDFVVSLDITLLLVEVKNAAYKHASYGRSKMAFAQAQIDYPMFVYRWAEKVGGEWHEKGEL